jgi:hypothetical protein
MENNLMTVFTRIFHTQGDSLVELSAWIENVRNGQWKNEVENYRRLMAEGKKQEAASVKEQLPALVPAGNCLRGRYPKCLTNRTGYAMFDMDKMPPDVLRNAFARLKEIPWVAACHVTVSGTGLRIFVCIGVVHPDVYRRAYEIVAHALEQVAGHPCDMQCKDLCRLTLASYDPEAYLAPEPLTFPYEEGNNPLLYQPATEPTLPRITGSTAETQGIRVDRLPEICPVMLPGIRLIMLPETPVSGPSESPKIPTTTAVMYPSVTPKLFWRIFSGKTSFRRVSGTMFCSVWDATSAGGGSIRTTLNG